MKKLIFASFIIALAFSACSKKTATTTIAAHPIEITDYAERTVILEKPAQKIVVMADNALAVVKHLNAIDTVIALDSKTKGYLPISLLSETDPNLHNLPDVGKTKSPNYEYIISLAPDLILFKGNKDSADMLQEKTGVPVACILSNMGDYDFDLYAKIGRRGIDTADKIRDEIKKQGFELYVDTPTNLIFVTMTETQARKLSEHIAFRTWEKLPPDKVVVRLVTSWATKDNEVEVLLNELRRLKFV